MKKASVCKGRPRRGIGSCAQRHGCCRCGRSTWCVVARGVVVFIRVWVRDAEHSTHHNDDPGLGILDWRCSRARRSQVVVCSCVARGRVAETDYLQCNAGGCRPSQGYLLQATGARVKAIAPPSVPDGSFQHGGTTTQAGVPRHVTSRSTTHAYLWHTPPRIAPVC